MWTSDASKLTCWRGGVRIIKKRSTSGGRKSAMSRDVTPIPFDELIFAPPTRKKSYGQFNGGSTPKISRRQAAATSREPPFVLWSRPAPSIVTGNVFHFAHHSSFQGNFPLPSNGDIFPS